MNITPYTTLAILAPICLVEQAHAQASQASLQIAQQLARYVTIRSEVNLWAVQQPVEATSYAVYQYDMLAQEFCNWIYTTLMNSNKKEVKEAFSHPDIVKMYSEEWNRTCKAISLSVINMSGFRMTAAATREFNEAYKRYNSVVRIASDVLGIDVSSHRGARPQVDAVPASNNNYMDAYNQYRQRQIDAGIGIPNY